MFQPEVKLEFIRRYCSPTNGWTVYVDIDPSEEGLTGSKREGDAVQRQRRMQEQGRHCRETLTKLGVTLGGARKWWGMNQELPKVAGDRDIIAFHKERRLCVVAEVEGDSSGQPEQKLYKAIGQLVMAASTPAPNDWSRHLVLVVEDGRMTQHLKCADALVQLGITRLALASKTEADQWFPRDSLLPKLLSGAEQDKN